MSKVICKEQGTVSLMEEYDQKRYPDVDIVRP